MFQIFDETHEFLEANHDRVTESINVLLNNMKASQAGWIRSTNIDRCCPSANSCPFACHADHENDD